MSRVKFKLTLQQERIAYRRAVLLSLEAFFGKSPREALALVDAWWERMGRGEVYRTGLFLHDEPINAAADLAGSKEAPAIRDVADAYARIIDASMPKPRRSRIKPQAEALPMARAA
jgi:hypothetical protein